MGDIKDDIVRKLKLRAARNGRSAEEEHRQTLRRPLKGRTTSLHDAISQMPDVGDDSDFERVDDLGRPVDL